MSITSLSFMLFIAVAFALYYLLPKRFQWCVLLAASIFFYLYAGFKSAIYIFITATTIYFATIALQKLTDTRKQYFKENKGTLSKEEKAIYKAGIQKKRMWVMVGTLLLNIGFLCVFKYFHFALEQLNQIILLFGGNRIEDTFHLIVPLGISFYTF